MKELIIKKLQYLKKKLILETDASVQFKLQHQIDELETQLQEHQNSDEMTSVAKPLVNTPEIYCSYAWKSDDTTGSDREILVDRFYDSLITDGFNVKRDKVNVAYGDSIKAFMEKLGRSKLIAVFISDKYMKSPNCMFELFEIARDNKFEATAFANRILPVFVEYIDFNSIPTLTTYLDYWRAKEEEWAALFKGDYAQAMSPEYYQKYTTIKEIHQSFTKIAGWLSDLNASTPQLLSENDFAMMKATILKRIEMRATTPISNNSGNGISLSSTPAKTSLTDKQMKTKQDILVLIDSDIDAAFDALDKIFETSNITYNQLCDKYTDPPQGFSLTTFASQLKRFVNRKVK